ncbi:hypothetical protein Taro_023923 [Colocasia esculenta]|uniref:Uncharacterized protein n=1 Tax=Colocasia esculenta TaxID=4460 RepID=A0A843VIT7_COLES|nr:hypothetical protein [Colocasia esculenta]
MFRVLLCLDGCVPRICFRIVFWPDPFLLLWLVRDWLSLLSLVRKAHPPTLFSFPARSECELQESVAAVAGCACFKRGCWFAHAAVGFIVGLRIRVGVSQRLREPTCGVAFTGAGLWSTEPVEGVLALLVVPFLWGESLLDVPLLMGCVLLAVCLALHACAPLGAVLCSVSVFARAKQMLVCCVAPLVECCDTSLPFGWGASLSCCVLVVFPKTVCCCPSESSSPSGTASVLVEVFHCVASLCGFPKLLVVVLVRVALRTNGALVILVEFLPEPVVLLPLSAVFSLLAVCLGCVLVMGPRTALGALGGGCLSVRLRVLGHAGGTSCVPMVGRFASFLAPCGLCQIVVWHRSVCVLLVPQLCFGGTCRRLVCALPTWVVGAVPCVCTLLRANMGVALLKLLVFRAFLLWVSGGETLSVGLESFQATVWLCLLWRVLPVSRVVSAVGATVLHPAEFWCLWWHPLLVLEWFVFMSSGALVHCVVPWVAPGAGVSTVCVFRVALLVVRQAVVVASVQRMKWGKKNSIRQLEGGKVNLNSFSVGVKRPKISNSLLELTKLNLRKMIEISVVIEHLKVPDHFDFLLNEQSLGVLVKDLEPL